ncbi:hypothetical protein E2562_004945 [Oryza meyeriana var. granulata]|uniref:Uncharacterized protein n=1 Tax=Oryza meyeriana var. granulata TaxID=110450 RepID=A0A6G1C4J6_9ORYZ|nr:hypothetical protein E2562_004945 [Oryza meyeriana var. granulata]
MCADGLLVTCDGRLLLGHCLLTVLCLLDARIGLHLEGIGELLLALEHFRCLFSLFFYGNGLITLCSQGRAQPLHLCDATIIDRFGRMDKGLQLLAPLLKTGLFYS